LLGVFLGAVAECGLGIGANWARVEFDLRELLSFRIPAVLFLGGAYALGTASIWSWTWWLCRRTEDVPRAVPILAALSLPATFLLLVGCLSAIG
jgi:hypothetical protein